MKIKLEREREREKSRAEQLFVCYLGLDMDLWLSFRLSLTSDLKPPDKKDIFHSLLLLSNSLLLVLNYIIHSFSFFSFFFRIYKISQATKFINYSTKPTQATIMQY